MDKEREPLLRPSTMAALENLTASVRKFTECIPQTVQAITACAYSAVNLFAAAAEVCFVYKTEQEAADEWDKLVDWVKRNLEPKYLIDHALEWAKIHRPSWVHQYKYAKKRRVRNKYKNRILRAYIGRS